ncbi:MAG: ribose 5-phosphate isomerase A [Gemmatimonadota bacterium]
MRTEGWAAAAEQGKAQAGRAAAALVENGMRLGLGTGSTVDHFLVELSRRCREEGLERVVGVPTSQRTHQRALELGIVLVELADIGDLDLTVDGADEVDPKLDLIKGMGGALFREKMVALASHRMVVVADSGKSVKRLGTLSPLPVEVVPFGWSSHSAFFRECGAEPIQRLTPDGTAYVTDNGNFIVDLTFPDGIPDAMGLEEALTGRLGVVASGLFLGMATEVFMGSEDGVITRVRGGGS